MAREYGNRRSSRSRANTSQQFLVITVAFLLGYLTASFLNIEMIGDWLNTQVLAHQEAKKQSVQPEAQRAVIPPKPKFEFYTLLANEKVPSSQSGTHAAATQSAAVATTSATNSATGTLAVVAAKPNAPKMQQQPAAIKAVEAKAVTPHTEGKGNYLVQVASFKARNDAEHMKGLLTLKGFNVYIVPVSHAVKGNWFRVVVGPYPSRVLAQQAQMTLAKNEHLHGMITGK